MTGEPQRLAAPDRHHLSALEQKVAALEGLAAKRVVKPESMYLKAGKFMLGSFVAVPFVFAWYVGMKLAYAGFRNPGKAATALLAGGLIAYTAHQQGCNARTMPQAAIEAGTSALERYGKRPPASEENERLRRHMEALERKLQERESRAAPQASALPQALAAAGTMGDGAETQSALPAACVSTDRSSWDAAKWAWQSRRGQVESMLSRTYTGGPAVFESTLKEADYVKVYPPRDVDKYPISVTSAQDTKRAEAMLSDLAIQGRELSPGERFDIRLEQQGENGSCDALTVTVQGSPSMDPKHTGPTGRPRLLRKMYVRHMRSEGRIFKSEKLLSERTFMDKASAVWEREHYELTLGRGEFVDVLNEQLSSESSIEIYRILPDLLTQFDGARDGRITYDELAGKGQVELMYTQNAHAGGGYEQSHLYLKLRAR